MRPSFQITHATDDDTTEERDFLMKELLRCDAVGNVRSHRSGERLEIGKVNKYVTDGEIAVPDREDAVCPMRQLCRSYSGTLNSTIISSSRLDLLSSLRFPRPSELPF